MGAFDPRLYIEALVLSLTALAGWLGAVVSVGGLLFARRWALCVCDEAFGWSVGGAETLVRLSDIARIVIVSPAESADHLTLFLNSGDRVSVPSLCIGDLAHLCEVLHTLVPRIVVTYNGAPTCDVCGRPSLARIWPLVDAESECRADALPIFVCARHKSA